MEGENEDGCNGRTFVGGVLVDRLKGLILT